MNVATRVLQCLSFTLPILQPNCLNNYFNKFNCDTLQKRPPHSLELVLYPETYSYTLPESLKDDA
jgi:hypothetical protein